MASLLLRDLDADLHARLTLRARQHRRTVEEEAQEALRIAMAQDPVEQSGEYLLALADSLFGPENGIDLELPPRSGDRSRPPPDFSGPEYDR